MLDGRPLTGLESDKVRALLSYLAMHAGRPQRREILTGLLWPDSPETSARASLRNALANLRHAIGDHHSTTPFLTISRQIITFEESADYWLDIADFNHALQNSIASSDQDEFHLQNAVSLYRGPFLDGISVTSTSFQEWLLLERERLNRQIIDALRRLSLHYAEAGQLDKALDHAWRQVELEPWEEVGQRLLIRLLAASGHRGEALAQYARCCQLLRETLDVEPGAETVALHNQILAGEPLSASSMPANNLPVLLTPLVGREAEIAWVQSQLEAPLCRLITLTGPGGIGKTHLALQAVKATLHSFPDGAFLISLAALPSTPDFVPRLAQVLDLPVQDQTDLHSQLIDFLRPQSLLLILDSFEHLIAAPGLASQTGSKVVNSLLQEAPRLKIMVTSRMSLNLHGEHLLTLTGLNFPLEREASQANEAADLDNYSAMTLFMNSAHRHRPEYIPTATDLVEIGRICRQVEGLPLAILLAASWIDLLMPGEIAAEIDRDLDFLIVESGNFPQRHRSLRAVFDHSWRLLSESEQIIFQCLSVFRGGFTRAAAQSVAGASLQSLRTLANRSLLQRLPKERYTLHPMLRHFAAEKLARDPQTHAQIYRRHSAFYAAFCQEWAKQFKGKHHQAAVAEMRQEINNLQIAWDWAVTNRDLFLLAQSLDGLCRFYYDHGRFQKGLSICRAAAVLVEQKEAPAWLRLMVRSLSWQSVFSASLGHLDLAISLCQESLAMLQDKQLAAEDSRPEKAFALLQLAQHLTQRDLQEAGRLAEESASLYRELADQWGKADALETVGQVAWLTADYQNTFNTLQECLQLRRALNDSRGMAAVLGTLGFVCFQMGQFEQAEAFIREGISLRQQFGDLAGAADSLFNLAMAMLWLGEFEGVNKLLVPAIASFNKTGAVNEAIRLQALQAMAQALLGQYNEASAIAGAGLSYARTNGLGREIGILLWVLGFLSVATAEYDKAEEQLLESSHLLQSLGLLDILAAAQVARGYAALGMNDLQQALNHFTKAIPRRPDPQSNGLALLALPGLALLMALSGRIMRGIEIDGLASRFPFIANSRFFADVAGQPLAELLAGVPDEAVAQAKARGQTLDLQTAVTEILNDFKELPVTAS